MVDVGSGALFYYGNDKLGTPQIMTDSTNAVVWEGEYKPFGEADVNPNSTVVNNFRFPGQYFDQETSLHYNYNRYYDPSTGRYLTPDPIGLAGGINLFAYVENNPTNTIDPLGLYCKIDWGVPHSAGDPLRQWRSEEKIGYWNAVSKWLLFEAIIARVKLPIPNIGKYEYTIRHTIWQLLKEYIDYWEVCYDDCTHEETSRNYMRSGETGKTQQVILKQWDELRELK